MSTYTHAVLNKGQTFDLAIVNLNISTTSNLMNLSAPARFSISYDSGVGIVSFYEDGDPATPQTFAPSSTTAPFTFTSTLAPVAIGMDALDANGNPFTVSGPTIGRDSLLVGAGFSILWNDRFATTVFYDGELLRSNYSSNNVSVGFRYSF